ncbi:DoxX family membrane protein [Georgenia sp. H159]|uniref:DoxX family protein n=1 Tax=Georgenia sp. H159 TaxID=3076115 RepID=UPI002D767FAE|nr:DoxX family membrane protein [Georgenia sp. H159]
MTVFLVFLGATAASFLVAVLVLRRRPRASAVLALRGGLATLFLVTGTTHFVVLRDDLVAMVPPALPAPELLVTVTGVLELLGAVGLLVPATAAWAAGGLAVLLVAMFPANVHAASAGLTLGGDPATALLPRTLMQVAYLGAALAVVLATRRTAWRPGPARGRTERDLQDARR